MPSELSQATHYFPKSDTLLGSLTDASPNPNRLTIAPDFDLLFDVQHKCIGWCLYNCSRYLFHLDFLAKVQATSSLSARIIAAEVAHLIEFNYA